ncbi:MAG: carbohydrate ABC transporter permease [Erysipelotrichaceae bacterium]|nr:carbohydrate ABC transporter permease [Erysipelotrichaceae bacterium]
MIKTKGEKIFDFFNVIFMIIFALIFIIPILLLINSSFTETKSLTLHGYSLIIRDFSLDYYKAIFSMESNQFVISILNSVFVVVCTTILMIITTSLAAYALTRKKLQFKKFFTYFFIVSMLFSGGTIPYYILIKNLGLMNTLWALILPSGVSAWYILLTRKFFSQVPEALIEAAELDGASNIQILFKVILPLNLPIIATVSLYTSVAMWNDWFAASLFIDSNHYNLWPIQAFIRRVQDSDEFLKAYFGDTTLNYSGLRSATVIISLLPIVLIYPLLQKFFIKGSIEGGVKE